MLSATFVHSLQACSDQAFYMKTSPCAQCFPFPQLLLSETSLCWPRGTSCNWVLESWLNCARPKQRLDYPKQNIFCLRHVGCWWTVSWSGISALAFILFPIIGQKWMLFRNASSFLCSLWGYLFLTFAYGIAWSFGQNMQNELINKLWQFL